MPQGLVGLHHSQKGKFCSFNSSESFAQVWWGRLYIAFSLYLFIMMMLSKKKKSLIQPATDVEL